MILTCSSCSTRYSINAASIGPEGRLVKCAKCGHKWREFPPEDAPKKVEVPDIEAPEAPASAATDAPASGMSIEEMTQANRPRQRPQSASPKKKFNWLGWLIFILLLGAIGAGGYYGRNVIVQVMPGMASLYQTLKLDVKTTNLSGLEIRNLKTTSVVDGGVTRLTVTGDIVNITGQERPIPRIAVQLVDSKNKHVYSWSAKSETERVAAWETVTFSSSMNQPPKEAKHVKAHLILPKQQGSGEETHAPAVEAEKPAEHGATGGHDAGGHDAGDTHKPQDTHEKHN